MKDTMRDILKLIGDFLLICVIVGIVGAILVKVIKSVGILLLLIVAIIIALSIG